MPKASARAALLKFNLIINPYIKMVKSYGSKPLNSQNNTVVYPQKHVLATLF
jgi:hypothetical protein